MSDCLVEISPKDLPVLKNLYKNDESNNILAILTIENYIRWFEQDPAVEYVKFFCLNGDFSDGSFVVLASVYSGFVNYFNKMQMSNKVNILGFQHRLCGYTQRVKR